MYFTYVFFKCSWVYSSTAEEILQLLDCSSTMVLRYLVSVPVPWSRFLMWIFNFKSDLPLGMSPICDCVVTCEYIFAGGSGWGITSGKYSHKHRILRAFVTQNSGMATSEDKVIVQLSVAEHFRLFNVWVTVLGNVNSEPFPHS